MTTTEPHRHPLDGLLTVMWHYVRDPAQAPRVGSPGLDLATFDAQLDRLDRERAVVDWPSVAAALTGGPPLPAGAALLTFDDGLADHARSVAPRLDARGWRGVFFAMAREPGEPLTVGHALHVLLAPLGPDGLRDAVLDRLPAPDAARFEALQERERRAGTEPLDILKRPLQRDLLGVVEPILQELVEERVGPTGDVADSLHLAPADVATMRAAGHTIGGHGRRHLWFDHEPADRVAAEIAASAAFLAPEPGPWAFAYPYGASGGGSAGALERAGFAAAFHASPRLPGDRFGLGRADAEDPAFGDLVRRSVP
ncbi:MAG TPA: polysaccharide deacetylase family protein [Candidatus Limnocylindrales bacterium]|nr:polysaccharide deacetylase family protein [Candidatus Limnocylindrales bacterium]